MEQSKSREPNESTALTDYPRNDIETHRWVSNATVTLAALIGLVIAASGEGTMGVLVFAAGLAAANGMRLQATQWELELLQTELENE